MRTKAAAVALLGSLALAPSERIEFGPEPGTTARKRFETELEVSVERLTQITGSDLFRLLIKTGVLHSLEARAVARLDVDDLYRECRGGRPIRLARTYRTMSAQGRSRVFVDDGRPGGSRIEGTRELDVGGIKDVTVEFAWDELASAYARAPAEGDALDSALLATLTEDLDLRALLPEDGQPAAERWIVAWPRLAPVVLPGLLGRNVAAPQGLFPWLPDDLSTAIRQAFQDQHATCTRVGTRMVGTDECAVIRFRSEPRGDLRVGTLDGEASLLEFYGWRLALSRFDAEVAADLHGEILWSLDQRRFRTLEIEGTLAIEGTFSLRFGPPDELQWDGRIAEEASFDLKLSGDVRWSARAD